MTFQKGLAVAFVLGLLFMFGSLAYGSWTDTESVVIRGQYGKVDLTLNTYVIEIPGYLRPGFKETFSVQVVNTGSLTAKLSTKNFYLPTGVSVSTTFDKPILAGGDSTNAHITVRISTGLSQINELEVIKFMVDIIGTSTR